MFRTRLQNQTFVSGQIKKTLNVPLSVPLSVPISVPISVPLSVPSNIEKLFRNSEIFKMDLKNAWYVYWYT